MSTTPQRPTLWRSGPVDPMNRPSYREFGMSPWNGRFVYLLFNDHHELLYVGMTWNPYDRWSKHAASKQWWPDVRFAEVWLCHGRSHSDAERHARAVERWCIRNQHPKFNKQQKVSA